MSNEIKPIMFSCAGGVSSAIDYEYRQIIRKLAQYGLRPSGDKNTDKRRLHEKELEQAKKENCISSKFLTVSKLEQEKIQAKKKEKREEANPEVYPDSAKGQKALGEQIMLAINMRKEEEERLRKKFEEEKLKEKRINEIIKEEKRIEENSKISDNEEIDDKKKLKNINPIIGQETNI